MFKNMINYLPLKIIELAKKLPAPIFVVGGFVRNFLINGTPSSDIDLAGTLSIEDMNAALSVCGFKVVTEIDRTGTVIFFDGEQKYEYTRFRSEEYHGGEHTPFKTDFTDDIAVDALRRDFKCNAVYYDIKNQKIVDPLGGVDDIKNKVLDTVCEPEKVFSNDGLRLMRLARFAGELNFTPTEKVIDGAKKYAKNIKEISAERIYAELIKILHADTAYSFSSERGHYDALKILDRTRVLDYIIPELTDGRGMVQRADFHLYDVLEHSLRTVRHADKSVRLGALLHDVGKPFCLRRDGYYYQHFSEGEKIAENILNRLKADNETIKQVKFLVREHMVDLDCSMRESKVRMFIVKNHARLKELMLIKQADFRASLEAHDVAPTLIKWDRIYKKMLVDGTPFEIKDLKISAADLIGLGYEKEHIGKELKKLMDLCAVTPEKNKREDLLSIAERDMIRGFSKKQP